MNIVRPLSTLLLIAPLTACAATTMSGGGPQEAGVESKSENEEKLRNKQHELLCAELQLEIARLEAEADEGSAHHALQMAEVELMLAQQELQNAEHTVALAEARLELGLDRSRQNVLESEQELAELEGMYAQEEFAETTKELVLMRGRSRLEMSKRSLELAERSAQQEREHDLPRQLEQARLGVGKAEQTAAEASQRVQRGELERRLSLMKAEHALEELRREIEKLESKAEG